ncbi:hypothetical protein GCM10009117_04660 [Gangjinia marincola]|uniref:Phytanoyl-CoA dioxygenase n=1 Tax=Gangjinia marincola TaxID=578463 RepID=A0ABN1MDY3_9FLAO
MTNAFNIHAFNAKKYNFHEIISDFIGIDDLSQLKLNEEVSQDKFDDSYSMYKNMEQSEAYNKLYQKLNSPIGDQFYTLYGKFIREVIQPQYDEPIYFQEKPTHRIIFADTPGVSRLHRDSDYGHHPKEINYFLPQTKAFDTNTVWIESERGKEDLSPMNVRMGQYARFNGASLLHGAMPNTTNASRVSFDFRILKASDYTSQHTDQSNWEEKDKSNPLFRNAHGFVLCK